MPNDYTPSDEQMSRGSNKGKQTNQAENRTVGHVADGGLGDPHTSISMGTDICAETNFGIKHGEQVHYDMPTRSDSNKG